MLRLKTRPTRRADLRAIGLAALLGCADPGASSTDMLEQVLAPGGETRVVNLISTDSAGTTKRSPIVLSSDDKGRWSSAFRLLCNDCSRALSAFGYTINDTQYAAEYSDEAQLRAATRLGETPIVDLPLEERASDPAILAAFRVIDAQAGEPRYLVRLGASPEPLYAVECEDFLRVGQGDLATVPITRSLLLDLWKVPLPLARIGCSLLHGKLLPDRPAPSPAQRDTSVVPPLVEVWTVRRPYPGLSSTRYPYLVTRDAQGRRRGYAVDCGSESTAVLRAFGFELDEVRATDPSAEELEATGFGEQPILGCSGIAGRTITQLDSADDLDHQPRFQFGSGTPVVELGCPEATRYWSARATEQRAVPLRALGHLNDTGSDVGTTRTFAVGCRTVVARSVAALDGAVFSLRKQGAPSSASPFGNCLDVLNGVLASGTRLQSYSCNGSSAQTFLASYQGSGQWELRRNATSQCIAVPAAVQDGAVQQATCNGAPAQRFVLEPTTGGVQVRLAGEALCIDVDGNSEASGAVLQVYPCNGTPAQAFTALTPRLRKSQGAEVCVDGASRDARQPLTMVACDGSERQNWQFGARADGTLEVRRNSSGLCLTAASATAGADLSQAPCNGAAAQTWTVAYLAGRHYDGSGNTIAYGKTNLCVDIPGNSDASGAKLQLWTCNKSPAQIFGL